MKRNKKIKLKGSSILYRKRPINKIHKNRFKNPLNITLTHNKPINKINKNKKSTKIKNNTISINTNVRKNKEASKYLLDIIDKRYIFVGALIIICFLVVSAKLFQIQVLNAEKYSNDLIASTEKTVESSSAPRGRIYDRNYKLLVDNKAVKTIYYKKEKGITSKEEIELARKVAEMIDLDYTKLTDDMLKTFWIKNNPEKSKKKITDKEYEKYKERKLNDDDISNMIYERITEEDLSTVNDEQNRKAAYIYYLMNKGYSYSEKIIKNKEVTDEEYAIISENTESLKGFNTKLDWDRIYMYGDVFKSILGNVSSQNQGIPKELKEYYLKNGYSLDDRVGISYLEYQYEKYLRGTKTKYKIKNNNEYEIVSEGKRGDDIVLTIDIDLQQYLEEQLKEEVLATKLEPNTKYYDHSFAVISNPQTGEILAMAGKQVKKDENGKLYVEDYTPGIVTMSVTPGSIVKGASMLVGYKYGAISIGESLQDECIKIKATPEKCSWRTLGYINDIEALAYSSNVYQYKIAINVGKGKYKYNESLTLDEDAFNKYRDMYNSFGLGVLTEIDLPVESLGYTGKSKMPGHLLDFSIGQYDTYTPIQISQYVNTLANGGTRYKPYLLKEIYEANDDKSTTLGKKIYESSSETLGTVDVESKYMERVHEGFRAVVAYGLGTQYMGNYQEIGAGKTGTSQSFIDTNGDGTVDQETITTSFIGYAPYNDPKMSVVVVSPDVATADAETTSAINKRLSSKIVNKYFEINK